MAARDALQHLGQLFDLDPVVDERRQEERIAPQGVDLGNVRIDEHDLGERPFAVLLGHRWLVPGEWESMRVAGG